MPWHEAQFLKMTCLTGPFGVSTDGRVGFSRNCADTVETDRATATTAIDLVSILCVLRVLCVLDQLEGRKRSIARSDPVLLDSEQVQDADEQIGRPLRVVGEHDVTIPLERPVDSTDEDHRHLLVRVPM